MQFFFGVFCLVPSFEAYSLVSSFCLIFCIFSMTQAVLLLFPKLERIVLCMVVPFVACVCVWWPWLATWSCSWCRLGVLATLHWGYPGGMVRAEMGIRQGGPGAFHSECSGRTAELEVQARISWGSLHRGHCSGAAGADWGIRKGEGICVGGILFGSWGWGGVDLWIFSSSIPCATLCLLLPCHVI